MPSFLSSRQLVVATTALVYLAMSAASSAHARSDVTFSIGIHAPRAHGYAAPVHVPPPYGVVQPRPVFVQPRPYYVQSAPVFSQPRPVFLQTHPFYVQPAPVFSQPRPVFMQTHPFYVQPAPVFIQPRPVFLQPPNHRHYYGQEHGWRRAQWEREYLHEHPGRKGHGNKQGRHRD